MENEELIKDIMNDLRNERKFTRKLCIILCTTVIFLVAGIIATSIYNQHKILRFMNECEIESTMEMSNVNSTNYGSINKN